MQDINGRHHSMFFCRLCKIIAKRAETVIAFNHAFVVYAKIQDSYNGHPFWETKSNEGTLQQFRVLTLKRYALGFVAVTTASNAGYGHHLETRNHN